MCSGGWSAVMYACASRDAEQEEATISSCRALLASGADPALRSSRDFAVFGIGAGPCASDIAQHKRLAALAALLQEATKQCAGTDARILPRTTSMTMLDDSVTQHSQVVGAAADVPKLEAAVPPPPPPSLPLPRQPPRAAMAVGYSQPIALP